MVVGGIFSCRVFCWRGARDGFSVGIGALVDVVVVGVLPRRVLCWCHVYHGSRVRNG